MAMDAYKTLRGPAQAEYMVQKSRFIGYAMPVKTAEEALEFLGDVRQAHRDASHNCFAYVIGRNKSVIRYGDDGEPSGTAGKPMAEVLLKKDMTDCAVVVTRYFGGILLGAGGLVRAYTHAAGLALDAAGVCTMRETGRWQLTAAYPPWDRAERALKALPVMMESTTFEEAVRATILLRESDAAHAIAELNKATDGKLYAVRDADTFYHPWGDDPAASAGSRRDKEKA